jgi:hypothetical protein
VLLAPGLPVGPRPRLDLAGAASVTGALALLVFALVGANDAGWTSGRTLGLFGGAAALLALFLLIEIRVREPLVPLGIFRARGFSSGAFLTALLGAAWIPTWYFISLYLQQILGTSALRTGLAYLPMTLVLIVIMLGAISRLIGRFGLTTLTVGGLAILAAGAALFARVPAHGSYLADVLPASLVTAVGMALAFVPIMIGGLSGARPEDAGLASGLLNTAYQVGSALGLAVAVALAASRTAGQAGSGHIAALTTGFAGGFALAAGIALISAVVGLALLRRPHARTEEAAEQGESERLAM